MVCAPSEVKLEWTLILGRIAPAVFAHVPASMWGAMAGRSPHKAIFLQDTARDMNPYEMIVASLDVQGAFPHARHWLLTEVWDAMGLSFLSFMNGYIQTWVYAVITAAGLTPLDGHRQRGPPRWCPGPLPLPPRNSTAGIRASTGIPGVRPIPTTVPPHQLRGQQPPNYGHPPPRP